jgi:ComF family protein
MIERGFNQAEVIAGHLAKHTGIPIDSLSLSRKAHSQVHRVAMDMKARELSVKNAFEITRPNLVKGRNILLLDDVFTSGSTSSYCAKALKKSGAGKVNVLTLARAV